MAIVVPIVLALLVAGSQWVTNPEDMTRAFERAQKLLAGGDFTGAQRLYEDLLVLPDQALLHASRVRVTIDEREVGLQQAARYQLANLARKQAQLWQKEAELADSLHADSLHALIATNLAQAWSQWRAALREEAMTAAQRRPFLRGLGLCARERKDEADAAALYRELIASPESEAEGRLGLAQYHLDNGEGAQASAAVRPLLAEARPEVALQAHLLEGRALLAQERPGEARQVLQAGLARAPDAATRAELQFELGSAAMGLKDHPVAVQAFTAALEGAPGRERAARALYYLGHALQATGDSTGAAARLATLVSEYGDHAYAPEAAFLLGELRYARQDYPEALAWYTRVLTRWPDSPEEPEALYGAAWCELEQQHEEGMRTLFLRLAHEHPQHARAQQGLLHLGDFYYNEAKFAKATELYRQVVERFPQTAEAIQAEQVLVALSDVAADSLYQEGIRRFDAGAYREAIGVLEQVVVRYPSTPSQAAARYNIGVAYQLMGEYRQAATVYREAIQALEQRREEWRALAFAKENVDWIEAHVPEAAVQEVVARP
ncbi:MAG: tetratricopeptide repeat protein [Candidatus Latescibacterota bacterium]